MGKEGTWSKDLSAPVQFVSEAGQATCKVPAIVTGTDLPHLVHEPLTLYELFHLKGDRKRKAIMDSGPAWAGSYQDRKRARLSSPS
jgi:hypothetical protein